MHGGVGTHERSPSGARLRSSRAASSSAGEERSAGSQERRLPAQHTCGRGTQMPPDSKMRPRNHRAISGRFRGAHAAASAPTSGGRPDRRGRCVKARRRGGAAAQPHDDDSAQHPAPAPAPAPSGRVPAACFQQRRGAVGQSSLMIYGGLHLASRELGLFLCRDGGRRQWMEGERGRGGQCCKRAYALDACMCPPRGESDGRAGLGPDGWWVQ